MASGDRMVMMTARQAELVDLFAQKLMREALRDDASALMTLALAYKFSPEIDPPLPDNVIEFDRWSKRVPA